MASIMEGPSLLSCRRPPRPSRGRPRAGRFPAASTSFEDRSFEAPIEPETNGASSPDNGVLDDGEYDDYDARRRPPPTMSRSTTTAFRIQAPPGSRLSGRRSTTAWAPSPALELLI